MSFEKKMQKRGNQKLDQFAKNPYHQEVIPVAPTPKKRFPLWAGILIPTAVMATLMIFMLPMMMVATGAKNAAKPAGGDNYNPVIPADESKLPIDYSSRDNASASAQGDPKEGSQTYILPTWEEATIIEKYPDFVYQDVEYNVRYADSTKPIASNYINVKVADITVNPNIAYQKETYPTIEAELYSIKNIALEASLAIKFQNNENYYSYQNIGCYFADIGELLDKISFATEVSFPEVYHNDYDENDNYSRTTYHNASTSKIIEILFDDVTVKNAKTKQRLNALTSETSEPTQSSGGQQMPIQNKRNIAFLTAIPALGIDNASIQIYGNGTLNVNLFGTLAIFNLTEAKYQSLVTYITSLN